MEEERPLSIGQFLRQEREKRNIPLETISKATRITMKNLEALERDDFNAFSAPIFLKSFLRSYAETIGIDPHQVLTMYEAKTDLLGEDKDLKASAPEPPGRLFKYILPIIIILIAITVILFAVFRKPSPHSQATLPPRPPEVSPAPKTEPLPPPRGTPEQEKSSEAPRPGKGEKPPPPKPEIVPPPARPQASPEKSPGKVAPSKTAATDEEKGKELEKIIGIKALEEAWVRVTIDGKRSVEVLLQPGEAVRWAANHKFEVLLGNAGGVELSYNGVPEGRLGRSGEVVRLVLPKE